MFEDYKSVWYEGLSVRNVELKMYLNFFIDISVYISNRSQTLHITRLGAVVVDYVVGWAWKYLKGRDHKKKDGWANLIKG